MPLQPVFGSDEHQQLVIEVLGDVSTGYFHLGSYYQTNYFLVRDREFDYGLMRSDDLEVFTDKVRVACATYLERKKQNNLSSNNGN